MRNKRSGIGDWRLGFTPYTLRSTLYTLLILWLVACTPAGQNPIPTIAPAANLLATSTQPPATSTQPPATSTQPSTATSQPPTATSQPPTTTSQSPTATPTPNVIPSFLIEPINAPYYEAPLAAVACGGEGLYYQSSFPSPTTGTNRLYHIYLPPCYGQDGHVYPVLYLIHGSIQTDSHFLDLGLAAHLDEGIAAGRYPPFIVVMPFNDELGNNTSGGEGSVEGVTVNDLLPFVERTYCAWIDPAGRSIGGISRGGYWAMEIAFRHTHRFSSVSGHSTQLLLDVDDARYNPLATYATADLSQMRIWLDWGSRDFLREGQEEMQRLLNEANIPNDTTVNPGGHSDIYWQVHMQEYADWHAAAWSLDRATYPACTHSP